MCRLNYHQSRMAKFAQFVRRPDAVVSHYTLFVMNFHAPVVPNEVCHFQTHPPNPPTCFRFISEHAFRQTVPRTGPTRWHRQSTPGRIIFHFQLSQFFPFFMRFAAIAFTANNFLLEFNLVVPLTFPPAGIRVLPRCGEHTGNSWQSGPKKIPSYPSD